MKRVFHPVADTWQDVPTSAVSEWTDAGWLTKKPKHVDDSAAPVADAPYAPVPVVDNTPTPLPAGTPVVDNTPERRAATTKG